MKISIEALKSLKKLYTAIAVLDNNAPALDAFFESTAFIESYVTVFLRTPPQYEDIAHAMIMDWVMHGIDSPEQLIRQIKKTFPAQDMA